MHILLDKGYIADRCYLYRFRKFDISLYLTFINGLALRIAIASGILSSVLSGYLWRIEKLSLKFGCIVG